MNIFLKCLYPLFFVGQITFALFFLIAMLVATAVGFVVASVLYLAGYNEAGDNVYKFLEKHG